MRKHEVKLQPIFSLRSESNYYFPDHVFESECIKISTIYYLYYKFLLNIFKSILKLRLRILGSSYKKYKNDPLHRDVEDIYTREAESYEYKHHLTTNFRDTWWRRQIGLEVVNYIYTSRRNKEKINLLDLGTGIGLSLEEMFKIFKLFNVKVSAVGLDYNQKMLERSKKIVLPRMLKDDLLKDGIREIRFTRGDARKLIKENKSRQEGLEYFQRNLFDCITILFGIGGIDAHLESIREQLAILKLNGILAMTDIHRPFIRLKEKWPWFIGRENADAFTIMAWEEVTKPLILATLWGWRDPTRVFYIAPLVVDYNKEENIYYGFEVLFLFLNNESWWYNLPVMFTANIVLKKVKISETEFNKRMEVLNKLALNYK